ncbi:hypothetical protein ACIRPQ_29420 [Streptomyces sp. NPDC101213]|uniref:hypothetical protein n=1 Tax=Streptomyces sp. NPDC101213 TaxID=3366130 RepID=UPI00381ECBEA
MGTEQITTERLTVSGTEFVLLPCARVLALRAGCEPVVFASEAAGQGGEGFVDACLAWLDARMREEIAAREAAEDAEREALNARLAAQEQERKDEAAALAAQRAAELAAFVAQVA